MMMMMAGKKKSYGAKLRNWPVAHLRLALCSLGTLYTRHSHSPAGTLHIMHRPATLYMGCSQGTLYTQCSPDTICPVAFKIYLEHNNDDNLNFVGMVLDACLCGSKELQCTWSKQQWDYCSLNVLRLFGIKMITKKRH